MLWTGVDVNQTIQSYTQDPVYGDGRRFGPGRVFREEHGFTALHIAAQNGFLTAVDVLVKEGGANPNIEAGAGKVKPLHLAVKAGHSAVVNALLLASDGANVNDVVKDAETGASATLLGHAVKAGDLATVQVLLDHGAGINPAFVALAAKHNNSPIVQALVKAGADVNGKYGSGKTALHVAAAVGAIDTVKTLLSLGADIRAVDSAGSTALHAAAYQGSAELVRYLAAAPRAPIDALNRFADVTALSYAAEKGNIGAARALIAAGANVDRGRFSSSTGADYYSPLHCAARAGNVDMLHVLLAAGADVNRAPDHQRRHTPLTAAVMEGNVASAKALLDAGEEVRRIPGSALGESPVRHARKNGCDDLARALKQALNQPTSERRAAFIKGLAVEKVAQKPAKKPLKKLTEPTVVPLPSKSAQPQPRSTVVQLEPSQESDGRASSAVAAAQAVANEANETKEANEAEGASVPQSPSGVAIAGVPSESADASAMEKLVIRLDSVSENVVRLRRFSEALCRAETQHERSAARDSFSAEVERLQLNQYSLLGAILQMDPESPREQSIVRLARRVHSLNVEGIEAANSWLHVPNSAARSALRDGCRQWAEEVGELV